MFADLVRALVPYLDDIVFVGGWVHALYLLEAEGPETRTVGTYDIDVSLPGSLEAGERPTLIELIRQAGFEIEALDEATGLLEISRDSIPLDLLAEAPDARRPVTIEGQDQLTVQGYPHQEMLRRNSRPMLVGSEIHESLEKPLWIRVPSLPPAIGKLLSAASRSSSSKRAKDLAYLVELLRREAIRSDLRVGLSALSEANPEAFGSAGEYLSSVAGDDTLLRDVAAQVIEASGYGIEDDTTIRAQIRAHFRRLTDAWDR